MLRNQRSFTLIELLVVIAILAILAVAVVLVLNPAEFVRQSRDSARLQDLSTLNKALVLYQVDGKTSFGSSSVVYVSIPDSTSTCGNLGLPGLPSGWSYNCASSTNYRKVDGSGWIPVNLSSISYGAVMAKLPIDPVNTTSTGNYYTYVTGGSWTLTAMFESERYKMGGSSDKTSKDNGSFVELYEIGTNLTLHPVSRDPSLVGYWKFDQGTGATTYDSSGKNNTGTLTNGPTWTTGKVGNALSFDGVDDYVNCGNKPSLNFGTGDFSIEAWVKPNPAAYNYGSPASGNKHPEILGKKYQYNNYYPGYMVYLDYRNKGVMQIRINDGSFINDNTPMPNIDVFSKFTDGNWRHITFVVSPRNQVKFYLDGQYLDTQSITLTGSTDNNEYFDIGGRPEEPHKFNGTIDEARVYNRALSAAEIKAIYDATK